MDQGLIILGKSIGAAIAVLTGLGTGLGQGIAAGRIAEAISRNPKADSQIMGKVFVMFGIAESPAIYGLVVAMLILFML